MPRSDQVGWVARLVSARDKLSAVCRRSFTSCVAANRTASSRSRSRRRRKFCCSANTRSSCSLRAAGSSSEGGPAGSFSASSGGARLLASGVDEESVEACSGASLGSAAVASSGARGFSEVSALAIPALSSDGVIDPTQSNAARHSTRRRYCVAPPTAQPEGEHQQSDAEEQRVRSYPPSQHHGPDQRPDNQKDAPYHRDCSGERYKPSAMGDIQPETCAEHQRPSDNRPRAHQKNKGNNRYHRPDDSDAPGNKVENALEDQPSPALCLCAALTAAMIAKTPSTSM